MVDHWNVPYGCKEGPKHYPVFKAEPWQEAGEGETSSLEQVDRDSSQCPFKKRSDDYHVGYQEGMTLLAFEP